MGKDKVAEIKEHDLEVISTPYIAEGLFIMLVFIIIWKTRIPSMSLGEDLSIKQSLERIFKRKHIYWK